MIEDDDLPAGTADPLHLAHDGERIGHDADDVRGVDDVEGVVGEPEVGRVHLEQADVVQLLRTMRSRAFSSIEADRSMPVTEQSRG